MIFSVISLKTRKYSSSTKRTTMNVETGLSLKVNPHFKMSGSHPISEFSMDEYSPQQTCPGLFSSFQSACKWDHIYWLKWHEKNWTISLWISAIYVISVHLGIYLMRNQRPMKLKKSLVVWNFFLCIFSIIGSSKVLSKFPRILVQQGFHVSACQNFASGAEVFWGWLFVWSKVFELGDTVFIILRKRKLSFLHWYHHAITLISSFLFFPGMSAITQWTATMNFAVHSVMYGYYCIRALGLKVPRPIAVMITLSQITQMLIGFLVAGYELVMVITGVPCEMTIGLSIYSSIVYGTYFVLFLFFFFHTYLRSRGIFSSFITGVQRVEKSL